MASAPKSWYYICRCSGDCRRQSISRHGVDPQSWNIQVSGMKRVLITWKHFEHHRPFLQPVYHVKGQWCKGRCQCGQAFQQTVKRLVNWSHLPLKWHDYDEIRCIKFQPQRGIQCLNLNINLHFFLKDVNPCPSIARCLSITWTNTDLHSIRQTSTKLQANYRNLLIRCKIAFEISLTKLSAE